MRDYLKPLIEEEILEIEDIVANSSLSIQNEAPVIGEDGDDNVEHFN